MQLFDGVNVGNSSVLLKPLISFSKTTQLYFIVSANINDMVLLNKMKSFHGLMMFQYPHILFKNNKLKVSVFYLSFPLVFLTKDMGDKWRGFFMDLMSEQAAFFKSVRHILFRHNKP